mmetsp:Transcript_17268/g.37451  ORF Transcript_17268/g.37451 Transcript_17268/m.37451 type:complete len:247 (+) Transcript_17268:582-1322(+)
MEADLASATCHPHPRYSPHRCRRGWVSWPCSVVQRVWATWRRVRWGCYRAGWRSVGGVTCGRERRQRPRRPLWVGWADPDETHASAPSDAPCCAMQASPATPCSCSPPSARSSPPPAWPRPGTGSDQAAACFAFSALRVRSPQPAAPESVGRDCPRGFEVSGCSTCCGPTAAGSPSLSASSPPSAPHVGVSPPAPSPSTSPPWIALLPSPLRVLPVAQWRGASPPLPCLSAPQPATAAWSSPAPTP